MASAPETPLSEGQLADLAFLARTLADANRLRILFLLRHGRRSVNQIVEALGLSQPLVSHHLRELKRAVLVGVERQGPFVHYSLSRPEVIDLLTTMNDLAAALIAERTGF